MSGTLILRVVGAFGICLVVLLSVIPADVQFRTTASKGFEHAAAYLLLGLVLSKAYGSFKHSSAFVAFLLVLIAGALEVIQTWCPGRTPSVADWFAGGFGATIGVLLYVAQRGLWNGHESWVWRARSLPASAKARRLHYNNSGEADEVRCQRESEN